MIQVLPQAFRTRKFGGFSQKYRKLRKIKGIGFQRISRQPFLQAAEVEERGYPVVHLSRFGRERSRHRANDTISREMFET
jgi:hypothetical protein